MNSYLSKTTLVFVQKNIQWNITLWIPQHFRSACGTCGDSNQWRLPHLNPLLCCRGWWSCVRRATTQNSSGKHADMILFWTGFYLYLYLIFQIFIYILGICVLMFKRLVTMLNTIIDFTRTLFVLPRYELKHSKVLGTEILLLL